MTETKTEYQPSTVSAPGETIEDCLGERRIPVRVAAAALGLSLDDTERLLVGQLAINDALAAKLEAFLGVEREFWLKREAKYRRCLFEQKKDDALAMARTLFQDQASFLEVIRSLRSAFNFNLAEAKEITMNARDGRSLTLDQRQGELAKELEDELAQRDRVCAVERERVANAIEDAVRDGRLAAEALHACTFIRAMASEYD